MLQLLLFWVRKSLLPVVKADKEVINSAEIYNPELNQWEQMVARMEVPRVGLAMVSMGNLIYAIGELIHQNR